MKKKIKKLKTPDIKKDPYFICWDCAKEREGIFPSKHVCTVCTGKCEYCKKKDVTLIPIVDFDWKDKNYKLWRD